jgi:hypothetical protein
MRSGKYEYLSRVDREQFVGDFADISDMCCGLSFRRFMPTHYKNIMLKGLKIADQSQ